MRKARRSREALGKAIAGTGAREFLASRPVVAETEAVERALQMAKETGAKLHIVHMSSGAAVAMAVEARRQGVDVSIETCPHYLYFTEAGRRADRRCGEVRAAAASGQSTSSGMSSFAATSTSSRPIIRRPSHR